MCPVELDQIGERAHGSMRQAREVPADLHFELAEQDRKLGLPERERIG